ncbi:TRAFAC clade GTPase domain-containing protein [Lentzea sp. NPDC055074]
MTTPAPQKVQCPICLEFIDWNETELFRWVVDESGARWEPADLSNINNPVKWQDRHDRCYVKCPNPAGEHREHHIPVTYRNHEPPIIIGLVGPSKSGKTHLLASIVHAALRNDLRHYGLGFEPVDELRHASFQREITQLMRGTPLQATDFFKEEITTYLLLRTRSGRARPVVFFDVAGEDFTRVGPRRLGGQFVLGATALMFVDEPAGAVPALFGRGPGSRNEAFASALDRLERRKDMADLPIAVAVSKADQLRYEQPVDHWIRHDDLDHALDDGLFRAESRDVYAFLERYRGEAMLDVFARFKRGTLHVVSATGGGADNDNTQFPRGVRPARVLWPLLSLLAMCGAVEHPLAQEVGR